MKSKSITSVTFLLIGNMLLIYGSIGTSWTASLTAIFGVVLFFIGLSRLKLFLDDKGQNGVSKLIWSAILIIIATALSYIPLVGSIPAGIVNIIAFIILIVGLFNLKNSETLGETGEKGVNYLLVAMVLMIIVSVIGIVPLIGRLIKPVISFIAFILIPFGWLKIQEAIIEMDEKPELEIFPFDENLSGKLDNTKNASHNNYESNIKPENFSNGIDIIKELHEKGVLTSDEYESKIKELDQKKTDASILNKVCIETKPLIDQITELKNNGLLTEEEFNSKRSEIIEKHRKRIEEDFLNKQMKLSGISKEILNKLSSAKKYKLERLIEEMGESDIIVYNDNTLKLLSKERWDGIVSSGASDKYGIIYKYQESN